MNVAKKTILGLAIITILYACSKDDVQHDLHEKISTHLEATVEIEKSFEEHQEQIVELEKKDEEIYNKIIQLGTNSYEEVVALAEEAISLLDERDEQIRLEKESLTQSKEEFQQIETIIDTLPDSIEREQTEKMYDVMMKRYDAYDRVYAHYITSLRLTKELYEILQKEELNENEVFSLISSVNDSYDEVLKANEQFNKETVLYNELKQTYYEMFIE